jgi:hypothetical protein
MQEYQNERHQALRRIQRFMDQYDSSLGTLNTSRPRAELDELVSALDALVVEQRVATADHARWVLVKHARRHELKRDHMHPISTIARAYLHATPEIGDLAPRLEHGSDTALLAAASAMVASAAQHRAAFARQQLSGRFIQQLLAAAAAVAEAVREQAKSQERRSAAGAEVARVLTEAATLVPVLSALVELRIRCDVALLAAWRAAKRVRAAARSEPAAA